MSIPTPSTTINKYFFVLFFVLMLFLSYWIVKPLLTPVLMGMLLAYVVMPLYHFVQKKINSPTLAALLVSFVVLLVLSIPFYLVLSTSVDDARYIYIRTRQVIASGDLFTTGCESEGLLCKLTSPVQKILADPDVKLQLQNFVARAASSVIATVSNVVLAIPQLAMMTFIMFFSVFYFLKDGPRLVTKLKNLLPMKQSHKDNIFMKIDNVLFATIYGNLLIAVIQGALAWFGYWILGIPSSFIWGLLTGIFALLPLVGTGIVWLPASLLLMISGASGADPNGLAKGIGLLVYGALIIGSIDNIVRPKLVGSSSSIHPLLVLLGAIGGLLVFGFAGFFIGPVILALVTTLLDIYENDREVFEQF